MPLYVDLGGVERIPGGEVPSMSFAMANNIPTLGFSTENTQQWLSVRNLMGGRLLVGQRVFDPGFPADWSVSNAKDVAAQGLIPVWSFKVQGPDIDKAISGGLDVELRTLAATVPAGTYVTSYHEPEAGGSNNPPTGNAGVLAGRFRDYIAKIHSVFKSVNPDIHVGYCSMAYRWAERYGLRWDDYYPGDDHCDFLATDVYCMEFEALQPLYRKEDFMRWHSFARQTSKPMHIWEYGHTYGDKVQRYPDMTTWPNGGEPWATRTDPQIAKVISEDIQWAANNGFSLMSFWNCRLLEYDPSKFQGWPDGWREWAISGGWSQRAASAGQFSSSFSPDAFSAVLGAGAAVGDYRPKSREAWLKGVDRFGRDW